MTVQQDIQNEGLQEALYTGVVLAFMIILASAVFIFI